MIYFKRVLFLHTAAGIVVIAALIVILLTSSAATGTFRLDSGGQLRPIDSNDKFLIAAANIKRLGQERKTNQLKKAIKKLKQEFPSIAGPDFDSFAKAEIFYSKGKFDKAFYTYDSLLNNYPQSSFYQAAIDRQFSIGMAYLQGRKKKVFGIFRISGLEEGIKAMEKVSDRTGDSLIAVNALVAVAQTYENNKSYEEAYQEWSIISDRWPTGAIAKDALLGMARNQLAAYNGPDFDSTYLVSAKGYYSRFRSMYPDDAKTLNVDQILRQIDEQIAYKKYYIGKYYERTESKKGEVRPSMLYFDMVQANWPNTEAAKLAKTEEQKENLRGGK